MSKWVQRPLVTTRHVFVAVWLLLVFAMAGTIVVEGPRIAATTPSSVTTATATPSPSLPSGYRWYWFRSQWQQPEQPQP